MERQWQERLMNGAIQNEGPLRGRPRLCYVCVWRNGDGRGGSVAVNKWLYGWIAGWMNG